MNWRRGLLLAGINLLAAVPLICLLAVQDAQFLKEREQHSANQGGLRIDSSGEISAATTKSAALTKIVLVQDEQTVSFSPCGLWGHTPPQVSVVQLGNIPVSVLSQWQMICPPSWSIAHMLGVDASGVISPTNVKAMRRVDVVLCVLIALQWFLIGGFPLTQSNRWWGEPGAFITCNNLIAASIAIIPVVDGLARLPALIAGFTWLLWFGFAIWIGARWAWQSTLGRPPRLTH